MGVVLEMLAELEVTLFWTMRLWKCMCCGELVSACRMFEVMPDRDLVSWTAVISGYVRNERFWEA